MSDTFRHKDFIKALGGPAAVADARGVTLRAARSWQYRGVPWRQRPAVARIAEQMGVDLPPGFLDAPEGEAA